MRIEKQKSLSSELKERYLPVLTGEIFHVTSPESAKSILSSRYINPVSFPGIKPKWAGSPKSYFGEMGCVSVCDLTGENAFKVDTSINKYYFLNPKNESLVVYMIFYPEISADLIPWQSWKENGASNQIVPYLEAGHKGPISIEYISRIIEVEIC